MASYLFTNSFSAHAVEASGVAVARAYAREHIARQGFGRTAYNGLVEPFMRATYLYMWRVPSSWHSDADNRRRWDKAEKGIVTCAGCQKQMDVRSGQCFSVWYCTWECVPRS